LAECLGAGSGRQSRSAPPEKLHSHLSLEGPHTLTHRGRSDPELGWDTYHGIPILERFTWTVNPKGSKVVATWSQAFSTNGGKTWEVNWRNELIPDTR
jgi:hypothetical protein